MTTDEAFEKWLESDAAPDWIESKHARVGWEAAKADSKREIAELKENINRLREALLNIINENIRNRVNAPAKALFDITCEHKAKELLAETPAQSLKAHDDER